MRIRIQKKKIENQKNKSSKTMKCDKKLFSKHCIFFIFYQNLKRFALNGTELK